MYYVNKARKEYREYGVIFSDTWMNLRRSGFDPENVIDYFNGGELHGGIEEA